MAGRATIDALLGKPTDLRYTTTDYLTNDLTIRSKNKF